ADTRLRDPHCDLGAVGLTHSRRSVAVLALFLELVVGHKLAVLVVVEPRPAGELNREIGAIGHALAREWLGVTRHVLCLMVDHDQDVRALVHPVVDAIDRSLPSSSMESAR